MNAIHSNPNSTVLTRLIPFVFVLMLLCTSLAMTGCGVVDSNGPEDIERVLVHEPETVLKDSVDDVPASTAGQAKEDNDLEGDGSSDPYGNPVKDRDGS